VTGCGRLEQFSRGRPAVANRGIRSSAAGNADDPNASIPTVRRVAG